MSKQLEHSGCNVKTKISLSFNILLGKIRYELLRQTSDHGGFRANDISEIVKVFGIYLNLEGSEPTFFSAAQISPYAMFLLHR